MYGGGIGGANGDIPFAGIVIGCEATRSVYRYVAYATGDAGVEILNDSLAAKYPVIIQNVHDSPNAAYLVAESMRVKLCGCVPQKRLLDRDRVWVINYRKAFSLFP